MLQRYNRSEFHHIYPRAFLRDAGIPDEKINVLGNFCFLSAAENKSIGRKRPSEYVKDLVGDPEGRTHALASAFCVEGDFDDDYPKFLEERCKRLTDYANQLMV